MSPPSRLIAGTFLALALASPAGAVAGAVPAFDRLQAFWAGIQDYSMTIDAHEVLGDASGEAELHYAFKRPDHARLDVIRGAHSGSTVTWDGGDRVTAYKRIFSLFKIHPDVHDDRITSLRGNGIQTGNLGDVLACYAAHRDALRQIPGPLIDGKPTDEISLPYRDVTCPDDSPTDRGTVTLDVIDVERDTGLVVMRERYAGSLVVERWELTGYKINSGLDDSDLR